MAARNLIEVILRTRKEGKAIQETEKELGSLDKQTATTGKTLAGFGKILGAAAIVAGTATAALFAFKKVMDMGREGAAAIQTAESFAFLMGKVGASAGLLDELRAASRGTVDDLTLMEGTTSLLAGTQGELATQLANATPRLMEIAKAANKLNPALGDTTFMYKSLAIGVKRAQPLILDNLGLTIKVSEANEMFAEKLGKSVDALTSEEQKMALLEETLRAGSVMIDQVGGDTEAATDAFDELSAALKNVADEGKKNLVPTLSDVADGLLKVINLTLLYDKNLAGLQKLTVETADSYNDYVSAMLDGSVVMGVFTEKQVEALRAHLAQGKALEDFVNELPGYTLGVEDLTVQIDLMTEAEYDAMKAGKALDAIMADSGVRFLETEQAAEDFARAQGDGTDATEEQEDALKELEKQLQKTRDAYEDYFGVMAKGLGAFHALGKEQTQAANDYKKAIQDVNKEIRNVGAGMSIDFEKSLPDPTTVRDRAQMAGDAWDEWGLRFNDILANDVQSPWFQALQDMGMAKPPDVGVTEWAADLKAQFYEGELPELINDQAQAWVENTAVMKKAQQEATAAYNQEVANRKATLQGEKAALKAARAEELAAEKAVRDRSTLELALSLAEQTGMLQVWSQQKFGPDFSQVADSADEVLGLLDLSVSHI